MSVANFNSIILVQDFNEVFTQSEWNDDPVLDAKTLKSTKDNKFFGVHIREAIKVFKRR